MNICLNYHVQGNCFTYCTWQITHVPPSSLRDQQCKLVTSYSNQVCNLMKSWLIPRLKSGNPVKDYIPNVSCPPPFCSVPNPSKNPMEHSLQILHHSPLITNRGPSNMHPTVYVFSSRCMNTCAMVRKYLKTHPKWPLQLLQYYSSTHVIQAWRADNQQNKTPV